MKFLRLVQTCWRIIKNPNRTDLVIQCSDLLATPEKFSAVFEELNKYPELVAWLQTRPQPPEINLKKLTLMPEGSFGKSVADFFIVSHIDPLQYPLEDKSDIDYFRNYSRRCHDLWHVVTGYSTSVPDEIALSALVYAQTKSAAMAMNVALGILQGILFMPQQLPHYFDKIAEGWARGKAAQKFMAVPWDSLYEKSLHQVRVELKLV